MILIKIHKTYKIKNMSQNKNKIYKKIMKIQIKNKIYKKKKNMDFLNLLEFYLFLEN
jgi:hypothetical protein